jgi:N-methylhydantoinase A
MLSGPASGVMGATYVCVRAGYRDLITFDMGGTSADIALVRDGQPVYSTDETVGDFPIVMPVVGVSSIGAGGGSIAWLDPIGVLKVGPRSAGADPGPACYGRGTAATVTDANVVLGRLPAAHFLGGTMSLDVARARQALEQVRRAMRVRTVEEAAEGVVRVVEGNMERAIRTITVQRGQDPRSAVLFPFGGAAGLHACGLAGEMGFGEILVPRDPGLLSAVGILDGHVVIDRLVPLSAIDPSVKWLLARAVTGVAQVRREVAREGFAARAVKVTTYVRPRSHRQSIELEVPLAADFRRRFDDAHRALFHSADPHRPVEVVGLRVSGVGQEKAAPRQRKAAATRPRTATAPLATVPVFFGGKARATAIYQRESLAAGTRIAGPAIVVEYSSTTVVAPDWSAAVDAEGNLRLKPR